MGMSAPELGVGKGGGRDTIEEELGERWKGKWKGGWEGGEGEKRGGGG